MLKSLILNYQSGKNLGESMKTSVTQVLKTSRKTSESASIEVCQGSMDAVFRRTKFERARHVISEYSSETRVEITQTTVSPGMNEQSISHPAGPYQSSASAKAPIPLPASSRGDSRK